ncbi:MAG: hypothetical protein R3F62_08040 [Planctomycetota bacterium]
MPLVDPWTLTQRGEPTRCAFCHDGLREAWIPCPACGGAAHAECWAELGRCPNHGCGAAAPQHVARRGPRPPSDPRWAGGERGADLALWARRAAQALPLSDPLRGELRASVDAWQGRTWRTARQLALVLLLAFVCALTERAQAFAAGEPLHGAGLVFAFALCSAPGAAVMLRRLDFGARAQARLEEACAGTVTLLHVRVRLERRFRNGRVAACRFHTSAGDPAARRLSAVLDGHTAGSFAGETAWLTRVGPPRPVLVYAPLDGAPPLVLENASGERCVFVGPTDPLRASPPLVAKG